MSAGHVFACGGAKFWANSVRFFAISKKDLRRKPPGQTEKARNALFLFAFASIPFLRKNGRSVKITDFFRDTLKPVMQKEVRQIRKGEYKYPYRLELRLNETQMARLQSLASKSGLSMSAYVRQLIDGVLPQERPPLDFYKMLTELRYIGNNMNQLTRIAHATGRIDREKFERLTDEIKPLASMLYRYVTEPIKRDPMTSELGTYIRKSDQKALKEKREEERKWR